MSQQIEQNLMDQAEQLQEAVVTGNDGLKEIGEAIGDLKKVYKKNYSDFFAKLDELFFREAVYWEDVKDRVWRDEAIQNANHFPFLQGDLIVTNMVQSLAKYENPSNHWIVLEPTCGAARAKFVSVAPAFP